MPVKPRGKFNFFGCMAEMEKRRVKITPVPRIIPTKLFVPSGDNPSDSFSNKFIFELIKGEETKISANLPPKTFDCQGNLEVSPLYSRLK
jgi:hypothetical protein